MTNFKRADLLGFQKFLAEKLASPDDDLTLDDVIDQWRGEHPSPETADEDLEAIREALEDLDAGIKGRPLDEFDAEIRREFNFPPRP